MVDQLILTNRENESKNKVLQVESLTAVLEEFVSKGGDIIKELLRAAMVNPLLGVFVVLVLTDVLEKRQIIFSETAIMIKTLIVSAAGVELGAEIINVIRAILPFAPAVSPQPEIFKPSAQVIVFGEGMDSNKLSALLASVKLK